MFADAGSSIARVARMLAPRNRWNPTRLAALALFAPLVAVSVQACDEPTTPDECEPTCRADECGEHTRCGESFECGECIEGSQCYSGTCACIPETCWLRASCGTVEDGCGEVLECGECEGQMECGVRGDPNGCAVPADARSCTLSGWCWENPTPQAISPVDLHATAADSAWVTGLGGRVMFWDGERWNDVSLPEQIDAREIVSFGPDRAMVLSLNAVWTWDGSAWTRVDFVENLSDIDGSAPDDVYMLASYDGQGSLYHWDGTAWTILVTGEQRFSSLQVVDGTVWAADRGVYRLEGTTWVEKIPSIDDDLAVRGFYARTADEAWLVGWRGNSSLQDPFADADGWVINSLGAGEIFTGRPFDGIVGRPDAVFAIHGGAFSSLVGTSSIPGLTVDSASDEQLEKVVSVADGVHFAITDIGVRRFTGEEWEKDFVGTRADFTTLSVVGDQLFVHGAIWRGGLLGNPWVGPAAGYGPENTWGVVGDRLSRWKEGQWIDEHTLDEYLHGIAVDGSGGYWVAGQSIYHFDGSTVTTARAEGEIGYAQITSVDGEPWLVGGDAQSGVITRRVGGEWVDERIPQTQGVRYTAMAVLSAQDVWVVGYRGDFDDPTASVLSHFDGTAWTTTERQTPDALYSVAARSSTEVYAVGSRGTILRFDGTQWAVTRRPTTALSAP